MASSNLLERVMQLEEILAAVGYELRALTPSQAVRDPYTGDMLKHLWERANSATFNAQEAMSDLAGIVAHWTEITAAAPASGDASEDGAGGVEAEG